MIFIFFSMKNCIWVKGGC